MQVQKISLLTPNIGVVYSGMGPDSRVLVRKARKQAQAYYRLYHEHIPVAQLVRETAAVMQEFTRALRGARALRPGSFRPKLLKFMPKLLEAAPSAGTQPVALAPSAPFFLGLPSAPLILVERRVGWAQAANP